MDLSIIIVNWNSTELAKGCIESIAANSGHLKYEIVVVDNASSDESWRTLAEMFPSVLVIRSNRNLGFARANNLGVERSTGAKLLFLNPDTVVLVDALQRMVSELDSSPDVGAVGCRLLNGDMSLQTSCVQAFPNIPNQILAADWVKRRWPTLSLWGIRVLYSNDHAGSNDVDTVSGACLMVKDGVLQTVGGFSTEYFMYAEEADLCCKIRRAGWKIRYVGDAHIVHFGGQSTQKRDNGFADVMMRDSTFKLLRKFRGSHYAQLYRVALFASAVARLTILSPLLLLPKGLIERERVVRALKKWLRIAGWSVVRPQWTQQLGR